MHLRSVDDEWSKLRDQLPEGWQQAARTTRAIRRAVGPLSDPETLLRILLGRAGADQSLRGSVAHARESQLCDISDVALFKRELKSGDWLEWIAHAMLADTVAELPDCPLRLRLIDATTACCPGTDRADFRLHVNVELPGRRFTAVELTDGRGGESFKTLQIVPGDLLVADRVYATADGIEHVVLEGGAVLVRTNTTSLPMWAADGARLDPLVVARSLAPGKQDEVAVELRPPREGGTVIVGRLCIQALPPEQAEAAQRRVRRTKVAHGQAPW